MPRALLFCALSAAAALAGCATPEVKQAQDTCVELGAPQGTENHAQCRARVAEVQQEAHEAKAAPAQTGGQAAAPTRP